MMNREAFLTVFVRTRPILPSEKCSNEMIRWAVAPNWPMTYAWADGESWGGNILAIVIVKQDHGPRFLPQGRDLVEMSWLRTLELGF